MLFTATSPGVKFLGKTAPLGSSATNTPTIVFGAGYEWIIVYHYIAGYSGGGGIARLQLGTGSAVDTGTNYSMVTSRLIAGGTTVGTTTSRVSQAGIEIANAATTSGRRGIHEIWNPVGDPKFLDSRTVTYTGNPTTAAVAAASMDLCAGMWVQNSEAQCIRMDGGSAGVSLLAGSFISVYGLPRVS